jgi:branched-chain amino acid transport system substrate-binding protein
VLYQNDDFGKDYLVGLREGLGDKADTLIVASKTYETSDPTVDSRLVALQGSGADVLLTAATPKFAAQAVRKVYDIGWKPTHSSPMCRFPLERSCDPQDLKRASESFRPAF